MGVLNEKEAPLAPKKSSYFSEGYVSIARNCIVFTEYYTPRNARIIYKSKIYYIKTLKMLLHISILRSSSGSTYCSLLKLHVQILNMSLYLSVMWQHIVCFCMRFYSVPGVCGLASQSTYPLH